MIPTITVSVFNEYKIPMSGFVCDEESKHTLNISHVKKINN